MTDFKDQFVQAGGFKTRYWRIGQSDIPLVMLHGLGGTIEDWVGTLTPLSAHRQVIAIDLLGSGKSDKPSDCRYSLDIMRDHIVATLDALELEKIDLNGWSLGARIALDIASLVPDRINRLVLTAPAGIGPDTILDLTAPAHEILIQLATRPTASAVRLIDNVIKSDSGFRMLQFSKRRLQLVADARSRAAFMCQLRSLVGPSGYLSGPREDILSKLPQIAVPTSAIWGREDHLAPSSHAEILARLMPNCDVHFIEDCGHTPHIEWPDKYNAILSGFLE
ncbi:alpha/beta fold hydrolase [Roseobacter sp. CCS2]|uniref:alpha/beta fold hydrolase n=1 Tax=Roseobacter sp. CCS2 TaxID=391593 RepID=UPI0000F3C3E1|nr:alpha/beta fold hydrolase [Roseobacter sp. CCS2]EBA11573.1 probable hydrolase [Roseobacter sp. CCS2]